MSVAEARSESRTATARQAGAGVRPSAMSAGGQHRGFAVPFISPLLGGARMRINARGEGEFLLPNQHGTRGFLLEGWSALCETHAPTLHDHRLMQYLKRLPVLSPPNIQAASHLVAMEGFAGAAAARVAWRRERLEHNRLARRVALLRRLAGGSGEARWAASPCRAPLGSPEAIAWEAIGIGRIAELTGIGRPDIAVCVDDLSRALPCVGGADAPRARPSRLCAMLDACRVEWLESGRVEGHETPVSDGARQTASICLRLAEQAAGAVQAAALLLHGLDEACGQAGALIDLWRADRQAAAGLARKLELALDGWERICLLWRDAKTQHAEAPSCLGDEAARRTLVAELGRIACLLPARDAALPTQQEPRPIRATQPQEYEMRLSRNERIRLAELELDMADETGETAR